MPFEIRVNNPPTKILDRVNQLFGQLVNALVLKVSNTVQMVCDADKMLVETMFYTFTMDLSPALGTPVVMTTVPQNEIWEEVEICKCGTTGSTLIRLWKPGGNYVDYVDSTPTGSRMWNIRGAVLTPGMIVYILSSGNAADNARAMGIRYNRTIISK